MGSMRIVANVTLILSIILISATKIASINITKILDQHGDFSNFNGLLTQTGLADDINDRRTITVLAVDNSGMGPITSKPQEMARKILATHILLDYYDPKKLSDIATGKKNATLVTLFQATGAAIGEQGSLKVNQSGDDVVLGSAVNGAPQESRVVKSIELQPYDISVLQISQPIMTPGLDRVITSPVGSPKASTTLAGSPKKAQEGKVGPPPKSSYSATSPTPAESPSSRDADAAADDKKSVPTTNGGARMISTVWGVSVLASTGFLAWAI